MVNEPENEEKTHEKTNFQLHKPLILELLIDIRSIQTDFLLFFPPKGPKCLVWKILMVKN